jgi:DNA-binding response OmpR family regulator
MNPRRILCVHEGPGLEEIRNLLEVNGYEVLPASDGHKAMALLSSESLDGVVLNYDTTAPDGRMLRGRIRHACPEVPMLLFHDVEELKQLPLRVFGAYLSAPDTPDAVLAHMEPAAI